MIHELHRHIDCAVRPSTLVDLGFFKTEEEVRTHFWITKPLDSLKQVLDRFILFQRILSSIEVCERIAHEVVEDAHREGITHLELRYSPRFASGLSKLPWQEVLEAFHRGLEKGEVETGIKTGLICIVSRGYELGLAEETIDFAIQNKGIFIAVDLAGYEAGYPCRLYQRVFRKAIDVGLRVTVHAGEGTGPENVWEAVELLGANRIGHGVRSIEDKVLVKRLARDEILLEICPTSNVMTKGVESFATHPLPRFLDADIPCSISTDDPGIFGVTLQDEQERCRKYMGLTNADLQKCRQSASRHSFL